MRFGRTGIEARFAGRPVGSLAELATVLPVQVIDPEVHRLVEGGPQERRRYLDWGVFHVEPNFLEHWRRYQRALRQRNAALRPGSRRPSVRPGIRNWWRRASRWPTAAPGTAAAQAPCRRGRGTTARASRSRSALHRAGQRSARWRRRSRPPGRGTRAGADPQRAAPGGPVGPVRRSRRPGIGCPGSAETGGRGAAAGAAALRRGAGVGRRGATCG